MVLIASGSYGSSARFPQDKIDAFSQYVHSQLRNGELTLPQHATSESPDIFGIDSQSSVSSIFQYLDFDLPDSPHTLSDSLVIGDTPGETLLVTGNWFHDGPIFVINDGVLQFRNAQVTNLGNLNVVNSGRVYADSSRLFFPQIYWYQRTLLIAQNGYLRFDACTTSFSGYPYNLFMGDSARVELFNMHHEDFTTSLVSGRSSLFLDDVNLSGEYVMLDSATADFKNASTLLIWHHFPDVSVIDFTFPSGDSVYSYLFTDSLPGVDSVGYRVSADSCYDVMWGLMPTTGSDVQITNSSIRTIGVWFEGSDTINVSGLVNNSDYTDFTAPISDRNLHLVNTRVQTWSLYPFDYTNLNVTSCILGEVMTLNRSIVSLTNYFLDGSGGYLSATDTSFAFSVFCAVSSNVRSERSGVFLLGYAGVPRGDILGIGNSILIVLQSSLPQDPVPLEGSVAWLGNISGPSQAYAGDIVPIMGSAWIDRGPEHTLYDFGQYQMFYQGSGDTLWNSIEPPSLIEARDDTLSSWDTSTLNPGIYAVKIVLKNNFGDSVDVARTINLLTVGVEENSYEVLSDLEFRVSPLKVSSGASIYFSLPNPGHVSLIAYNILGRTVDRIYTGRIQEGEHEFLWKPPASGVYFLKLNRTHGSPLRPQKLVWIK
jgi:hypothetical protein